MPDPSVLIIGSEALPFSKTGGLADVLGALPQAIARLGWDVTLVVPRYRGTTVGERVDRIAVTVGGFHAEVDVYQADLGDGARALLVHEPSLYDRDSLYAANGVDYPDNARRFGVLARVALELSVRKGAGPHVVHAHDWQAGLAPVYLDTVYKTHPLLGQSASVFTIHNMAYQGAFESDWLPRLDLPWSLLSIEEMEFWGRISFLKGAINHADAITTVSPTYAREIQTPAFGFGFDGILRERADRLEGILNGIDTTQWDPATDAWLPSTFSRDDLTGKRDAKAIVLARYGLPADVVGLQRPLIGMISRMVDQKGLDLIEALGDELASMGASIVVLGTGDRRYEQWWRGLAARHGSTIGVQVGFDEGLAHLIEAGADMFLMPSRFEPCGLNQMYSLRYGTVPIVRRVGGLADTVRDEREGAAATGFVFDEYTPKALRETLVRALGVFSDKQRWLALQRSGMAQDHSWDRSAREYVKIYERAISKGDDSNGSR
ncbi:MAG: glycogen synthase GlgA [Vicinamibacterales bacterium]